MKLALFTTVALVLACAAYTASARNACHPANPLYYTSYCGDF